MPTSYAPNNLGHLPHARYGGIVIPMLIDVVNERCFDEGQEMGTSINTDSVHGEVVDPIQQTGCMVKSNDQSVPQCDVASAVDRSTVGGTEPPHGGTLNDASRRVVPENRKPSLPPKPAARPRPRDSTSESASRTGTRRRFQFARPAWILLHRTVSRI